MPPEVAPHLEDTDLAPELQREADRLRQAAARAELQPMLDRLKGARSLLRQLSGFIASEGLELPIDIDQQLTRWMHEDVMARKEQQS